MTIFQGWFNKLYSSIIIYLTYNQMQITHCRLKATNQFPLKIQLKQVKQLSLFFLNLNAVPNRYL